MTQKTPQDHRNQQNQVGGPGSADQGKNSQHRQDQGPKNNPHSGQGNSDDDERGEPGMQRPGQGGTELPPGRGK